MTGNKKSEVGKFILEAALLVNIIDSPRRAARQVFDREKLSCSFDYFRQAVRRQARLNEGVISDIIKDTAKLPKKEKEAKEPVGPKPFVLSAWDFDGEGRMMDIQEYCTKYNLPYDKVMNYRLVTHTGTPFYNTSFKETQGPEGEIDYEVVREILNKQLVKVYEPSPVTLFPLIHKEAVLKWADLHFGAHIRNLLLTHDYDSEILLDGLMSSVSGVNAMGFAKVHVHILGDLIESLSGLNHINSWQSMNKEETGANAIMFCCKLIAKSLREIKNLGTVKIIGGNHDRLSKDNDEEVRGGAAELICWGLELMGFDVEFHSYVMVHQVDGITHINLHGDKGISKHKTPDILWKYGHKGTFNFVFEAHLHSIIEKLSIAQRDNFKTITDDGVDHRRMHLPSFFTGNYYSETLGYNSNAGYVIVYDNGKGRPNIFTGSV